MKETKEKEILKTEKSKATANKKASSTTKKAASSADKAATKSKASATKKASISTNKAASSADKTATKSKSSAAKKTSTSTKKAASSADKTATKSKSSAAKKTSISTKKAASSADKTTTKSKSSAAKKTSTSTKKAASSADKTATKSKSSATKKTTTKSAKANVEKKVILESVEEYTTKPSEYYDLPYRYNETTVKILAQTPHSLFIYWDIADKDRTDMLEKYGENFFNETKPILVVHNKTLNTHYEIEIDDFTNSWYLQTPTSDCDFEIELGRKRYISNDVVKGEFFIAKSNNLKSPNDHIIKETSTKLYFKNIKTNQIELRDVPNSAVLNNIYALVGEYNNEFEKNPSSGFKIY